MPWCQPSEVLYEGDESPGALLEEDAGTMSGDVTHFARWRWAQWAMCDVPIAG